MQQERGDKIRSKTSSAPLALALTLAFATALAGSSAQAQSQQNNSAPLAGSAQSTFLQGGLEEKQQLKPSVLLKPSAQQTNLHPQAGSSNFPLGTDLDQFSGSVHRGDSRFGVEQIGPGSSGRMHGVISPISTYTLSPQNGRVWAAPGFGVENALVNPQSQAHQTDSSDTWRVNEMTRRGGFTVSELDPLLHGAPSRGGVTFWSGERAVLSLSTYSYRWQDSVWSIDRASGRHSSERTQSASPASNHGVVCWSPGYEISYQTAKWTKESLGGMWSADSPNVTPLIALAKKADFDNPNDKPLQAVAILLPKLRTTEAPAANFADWDERVANVIYGRWQLADVGPGVASMHITVTRDGVISAYISDFQPLVEGERDKTEEDRFKDAALRSVRSIYPFEIPRFPADSAQPSANLYLDLKRAVDGPSGVQVSSPK